MGNYREWSRIADYEDEDKMREALKAIVGMSDSARYMTEDDDLWPLVRDIGERAKEALR